MVEKKNSFSWIYGILALMAIIALGYFTFIYYVTSVTANFASLGLILVAVVAGISMFFNPCSFTLLPGFLSFFSKKAGSGNKIRGTLSLGIIAALGMITFSIILGLAIALLGEGFGKSLALASPNPNIFVVAFRGIIGAALISLGIMHFRNIGFHFGFLERFSQSLAPHKKGPIFGIYLYGFGYNALGIGCGGPIMAGLFVFALTAGGGFTSVLFAFLIFSLTLATLMIAMSLLVGYSQNTMIARLRGSSPKIKKVSGIILAIVGLFLLLSAIFVREFVSVLFPG